MIHFSKYTWLYVLISCVVIGTGLFSIVRWGYKISIDFTGGTEILYEIKYKSQVYPTQEMVKAAILEAKGEYYSSEVQRVGALWTESMKMNLLIRANKIDAKSELIVRNTLEKKLLNEPGDVTLLRLNTVGPIIGREAMQKTLIAVALGIFAILGYIFFAFKKMSFAIGAVVALMHDFLVVLGTYSLISHFMGAQLDTLFVTGLLTTMTFSTHDTIVIFDKIREYRKTRMNSPIEELADKAVSATMVRSVNNSLTIIFMLVALVLLGGTSIRFFAITLLIGTLTGVYSSPFVATPVMMWIEKHAKRKT